MRILKKYKKYLNISLCTNFISLLFIILGYVLDNIILKTVGLFAFSGAVTNWLAIFMLFEKIPFVYGSGVISARFDVFKLSIKKMMMNTFFKEDKIRSYLQQNFDISFIEKLPWDKWCEQIDYDNLYEGLVNVVMDSKLGGMLGMFGGASALEGMKPNIMQTFEQKFKQMVTEPKFQQKVAKGFKDKMSATNFLGTQIELLVDQQLQLLTPKMVKKLVQGLIKEHLGYLVLWGGIFGGFIGLLSCFL